jgi:Concanavalin A-like lectin/glucanases superfamily/Trypsin
MKKACTFLVFYVCVLLLCASTLLAVSRRHDVSDDEYVQLANNYPSVGRFTNGFSNGSGVLIAPRWVLMASHNLMFQTAPFAFEIGGEVYRIDWSRRHFAALPHPYAASSNHDIALAHLERPVKNVTPAKLYYENGELGMTVTIVGYGMGGDGLHGVPFDRSQQYKRAGQNVIDAIGRFDGRHVTIDASGALIFFDFDNPPSVSETQNWFGGSNTPLALEGMGTTGDSGGGLFVETPAGPKLIGINSSVFPGVSAGASHKYGIISINVRVSSYIRWIHETISKYESENEPLRGLVAHWDFDDLSEGFVHDVSGVGHRGNLVQAKPTKGILGGAVEFRSQRDASKLAMNKNEYVEVPNKTSAWNKVIANDLKIRKDITIAVWFNRAMPRTGGLKIDPLVAKVSVSKKNRDFALMIWQDHLRFYGGGESYARSLSHSMAYGTWQHIVTTRAGNTVKFYINGNFIGQDRLVEDFPLSDNPLIIGYLPDAGWNFDGKMDDLRIYNRSISHEEVVLLTCAKNLNPPFPHCDHRLRDSAMRP